MSEPTRREVLIFLEYCYKNSKVEIGSFDKQIIQSIIFIVKDYWRLIESQLSQPEVDEKFIDKWATIFAHFALGLTPDEASIEIREMLKEIPVRIKEKP